MVFNCNPWVFIQVDVFFVCNSIKVFCYHKNFLVKFFFVCSSTAIPAPFFKERMWAKNELEVILFCFVPLPFLAAQAAVLRCARAQ
jgi:hypothetical protein